MADPEASDHPPAKRFKHLHQEGPINGRHDDAAQPPLMAAAGASFHHIQSSSDLPANWSSQNPIFNPSWSWHSSPPSLHQQQQQQQQQQLQDHQPPPRLILEIQDEADFHQSAVWDSISPAASNTAPSASVVPFYTDSATQPSRLPRLLPAASDTSPDPTPTLPLDQRRRKARAKANLVSPFKDCVETFGKFTSLRFPRPRDGSVNGYVKFHWGKKSASISQPTSVAHSPINKPDSPTQALTAIPPLAPGLPVAVHNPIPEVPQAVPDALQLTPASSVTLELSTHSARSSISLTPHQLQAHLQAVSPQGVLVPAHQAAEFWEHYMNDSDGSENPYLSVELVSSGAEPQFLPPQFGFQAHMDSIDRRFFSFYVLNWCPGRTILKDSNLWLVDFAKMHANDGVRAAIQSLAGIYIYDYMPTDAIRKRVNQRFAQAEARFSYLLSNSNSITSQNSDEVITLSVLLSMQDIILTERRLKKPFIPRWLQGFRHGEHFLQTIDKGDRFWKERVAQMSSLHNAHCIMIGRGIILSQTMMALPAPANFDVEQEAVRFGWLLYGSPADMYEIHGGCGFSRKLLHIFSQITYCAARLQQERESPFVPMTAEYILRELGELRQWSKPPNEIKDNDIPEGPAPFDWESAKARQSTIKWVRSLPLDFYVSSSKDMTDVTAEAWRIAAIIYLQFRVLRLPRNDPMVMQQLDDLARCIQVMPTSGNHFTAQAPLFPVFLLGLAGTIPEHKEVARAWFEQVVETPVRSSVPPLYRALKRIWSWLDAENELPSPTAQPQTQTSPIHKRRPWWERLVARIQEKEEETLCLT